MKTRQSTLLLLTALIGVSIGWIVSERRHAVRRKNELLFMHELARFNANNAAYRAADAFCGTADYQITKERMLVNSIKLTYRMLTGSAQLEVVPSEEYRLAFRDVARESCLLLNVKSVSDFQELEKKWAADHPDMPTGPPTLDPKTNTLSPSFARFLEELLSAEPN